MSKDKVIFGEVHSIVEKTRTQPTGMVGKRIKEHDVKANKQKVNTKKLNTHIKKPDSFSK